MGHEYSIMYGVQCHLCRTKYDLTMDENGDHICEGCLFETSINKNSLIDVIILSVVETIMGENDGN